ncbi:MAG: response regulator [Pseudomonadota bacterium]
MEKNKIIAHILIIDDERDIREGCERILSRMGCQVYVAENGKDGLDIIEKEEICMVICDIKMPGMDGIEVLSHIKKNNENIIVIMVTGYSTIETAIEAMKKGAYDFISKPFSPDQLRIVVKRAIEKLRLEKEAREFKEERRQNLADLGTEQSRARTIVESLPNGVLVTNMRGQIVLLNPIARTFLGLSEDRGLGEPIADCIKDEGLSKYMMSVSQFGRSEDKGIKPYELALSEDRYILAQGKPVVGGAGQCLGAVVTLSDITEIKLLDRLRSEFVAKVSHELRSPLSIIHLQLAMVLRKAAMGRIDDSQEIIGRAKEKARTMISMIGDLLDMSKIKAGKNSQKTEAIRMDELLINLVDFLKPEAQEKKQSLKIKILDENISPIIADPIALESIFNNLISNAIKYTPENGMIQVRLDTRDNQVRVRVKDNGFGIDKKHQSKIFEQFYRIKNDETRFINGTGLGLSIAKAMVDALGGQIYVDSQAGKGSEFTVLLPIAG